MSVKQFIPTIWSARCLARLNDNLIFGQVVNRDYEGEIRDVGDTVKINEIGPVTIRDYTRNTTSDITVEKLEDAQKELKISEAKYFAFEVDDVDKRQAKGDYLAKAMDEAMWGMRNAIDEFVAALHSSAGETIGSSGSGKDVASTSVLKYLSEVQQKLDEANVPYGSRWLIIPPWFAQKMVLAGMTKLGSAATGLMRNAQLDLGPVNYGFNSVLVSNNVVNGTPAGNNAKILAGYRDSISLVTQILNTEAVRPSKSFADMVKGLAVYGAKVVRPSTLVCLTADYQAEAT